VASAGLWARRAVVGTLVGIAPPVALVQVAGAADRTARRGAVPAVVAAPMRRLPGLVAGADPAKELREKLAALAPDINATSCLAVTVRGATVYANQADMPVVPASNEKLVTAAVALDVLGPTFTYKTSVLAVGAPDAAGAVAGDLYLVGGGDPLLSTAAYRAALATDPTDGGGPRTSLEALADAVVAAGVRSVTGAVVGDDGRYDHQYYVARWGTRYRDSTGLSSALAVNEGLAKLQPRTPATDPAASAAATFAALLTERGVRVGAAAHAGAAPRDATAVGALTSVPFAAVIHEVLARSDNSGAELLVKEIGVAAKGEGTTAAGLAVMTEKFTAWMTAAGIPTAGTVLADGSGLSAENRLTCNALAALLDRYPQDSPLVQGLAVAGVHGTLVDNLKGTAAEGRLRGKTGSLNSQDTKVLSGVWPTADGAELLRFSYVLRRAGIAATDSRVDPYWTRLVAALIAYPYRPDLTPYGPRPPIA
jgi:serine-type D-Ala-D-Ala carboxypeptidase/endopeptidase (penicillin-binding protein 4)